MIPIRVECENCGYGHLWIPEGVQRQLDAQYARIANLEAALQEVVSTGDHAAWYHQIAREALNG